MGDNVLAVLTYKSIATLISTGGTQSWALDRSRAKACKYVLVCRNARHPDVEGNESHGHGFLVAKIKDVVPSTETKGRWLVLFTEYCARDFGDQWEGRNPVAYWQTTDFRSINFDTLNFVAMPDLKNRNQEERALSIEQAKAGLALKFGVEPSSIEIVIRA